MWGLFARNLISADFPRSWFPVAQESPCPDRIHWNSPPPRLAERSFWTDYPGQWFKVGFIDRLVSMSMRGDTSLSGTGRSRVMFHIERPRAGIRSLIASIMEVIGNTYNSGMMNALNSLSYLDIVSKLVLWSISKAWACPMNCSKSS